MDPEQSAAAFSLVKEPAFWCRARLFQALAAADKKGVLEEVLDEMELSPANKMTVLEHVRYHWGSL